MFKKLALSIAICALCVIPVVGCARNTTTPPSPTNTPMTSPLAMTSPSPAVTNTPGISPFTSISPSPNLVNPSPDLISPSPNGNDSAELADKIKAEVNKLSEISSAACVVEGTTAIVGVKFHDNYKGDMTTRINDMIEEKVKSVDSNIRDVVVTDDQADIDEIEDMRAGVSGGTLAGDLRAKFDSMLNRLKPRA